MYVYIMYIYIHIHIYKRSSAHERQLCFAQSSSATLLHGLTPYPWTPPPLPMPTALGSIVRLPLPHPKRHATILPYPPYERGPARD